MSRKKAVQEGRRPSTGASSRIYSRSNVSRYSERARQRRRGRAIRRGILGGLCAVLLFGVVAAGAWFMRITGNMSGPAGYLSSSLLQVLNDSDVAREPFYVLLLGTDGRPGEDTFRSDSIILARIDPTEKAATLISIPRDTYIEYKGEGMKINATHALDGPEGVVQAVNELCFNGEQKISHYAEIDFEGMQQLIDAVGGIDINATEAVDDPEHLDIKIEEGYQHMDGATALTYARCRYIYADGDYTRMKHQRQVLAALAQKVLNELDITNVMGTVESLSEIVTTTLSVQDIISVVNAMRGMDVSGMYVTTLPSWAGEDTYVNGQSYVFVYEDKLAAMMERVDAGEDPQGSQTMGDTSDGSSTVADIGALGDTASSSNDSDSAESESDE